MRMNNNGAYTHNVWIRMEVGTHQWGTVAGREGGIGRQYFFYLGNNNNANGGFIHHRFMQEIIGMLVLPMPTGYHLRHGPWSQ